VTDKPTKAKDTVATRYSDREIGVTRWFDAPAQLVFAAWSQAELFRQWWVPQSLGANLLSCEMDVRTGGKYRLVFGTDAANSMAFFGTYLEVVPNQKIVWSNEEGEDGAIATVVLDEQDGGTLVRFSETYPSKEALEASLGGLDAAGEQFAQLDAVLETLKGT
jgi:uncharacterized protein YndB with AHSA1/START domain